MCMGLGVKGDVHEIEQFYSEVSSINLEMAGLFDLRALGLVAGYQINGREMTPMEDPVEPEPVPDVEPEKEENPVASGLFIGSTHPLQTKSI